MYYNITFWLKLCTQPSQTNANPSVWLSFRDLVGLLLDDLGPTNRTTNKKTTNQTNSVQQPPPAITKKHKQWPCLWLVDLNWWNHVQLLRCCSSYHHLNQGNAWFWIHFPFMVHSIMYSCFIEFFNSKYINYCMTSILKILTVSRTCTLVLPLPMPSVLGSYVKLSLLSTMLHTMLHEGLQIGLLGPALGWPAWASCYSTEVFCFIYTQQKNIVTRHFPKDGSTCFHNFKIFKPFFGVMS